MQGFAVSPRRTAGSRSAVAPPEKSPQGARRSPRSMALPGESFVTQGSTKRSQLRRRRPMQLNAEQLRALDKDGYLFLPNRFTPDEVRVLREHRDRVFALERPEIVREKLSGAPRTAFACQTYDEAYSRL